MFDDADKQWPLWKYFFITFGQVACKLYFLWHLSAFTIYQLFACLLSHTGRNNVKRTIWFVFSLRCKKQRNLYRKREICLWNVQACQNLAVLNFIHLRNLSVVNFVNKTTTKNVLKVLCLSRSTGLWASHHQKLDSSTPGWVLSKIPLQTIAKWIQWN